MSLLNMKTFAEEEHDTEVFERGRVVGKEEALRALTAAPVEVPRGDNADGARGYALLGIGAYLINHSAAGEPPELVISIATEEEKAGRVIGDERDNAPGSVILPESMVVRFGFHSVVGLDALESQLRDVRLVHFPAAPKSVAPSDSEAMAEMEQRKDAAYLERNQVVAALAKIVLQNEGCAGIARTAIEGWSEDWHGCVYIDLPTGQASWHYHDSYAHLFADLPLYSRTWDGHTTSEKYQRLALLASPIAPPTEPINRSPEIPDNSVDTHLARIAVLEAALRPFSDKHEAKADAIGDSDLDNEQPRSVYVTLGDFRRAWRALNK